MLLARRSKYAARPASHGSDAIECFAIGGLHVRGGTPSRAMQPCTARKGRASMRLLLFLRSFGRWRAVGLLVRRGTGGRVSRRWNVGCCVGARRRCRGIGWRRRRSCRRWCCRRCGCRSGSLRSVRCGRWRSLRQGSGRGECSQSDIRYKLHGSYPRSLKPTPNCCRED